MPNSDLDKAFVLIEEGNALEKEGNFWKSAQKFAEAMTLLEMLAKSSPCDTEEHAKIVELYKDKSNHYRRVARESLIQALQEEKKQDAEGDDDGEIVVSTISRQEAESRISTFSLLFSKTIEDVGEKTSNLEQRLMELNSSLPSGFKTEKERLADINRGLGRLGLSLYPNSNHGSSTDIAPPQSEEEQVAAIISQAKDEVRFEAKPAPSGGGDDGESDDTSDDDESSSSDSEDSVSLDDLVNEPILKNHKSIRHKVVKAQVKLAELVALLNIEPDIDLSEDATEKKDDNNDDEQGKGVFDVEYGRTILVSARGVLNKALKDWPQSSS